MNDNLSILFTAMQAYGEPSSGTGEPSEVPSSELEAKMLSNIQEVKARGAAVIAVVSRLLLLQQDDLGTATGSELPTSEGTKAGPGLSVLRTAAGHRTQAGTAAGAHAWPPRPATWRSSDSWRSTTWVSPSTPPASASARRRD